MFKLPVKIKKLSENAVIPFYATNGSAGMDLTATSEKITHENGVAYIEYGTGIAVELPPGFYALLIPRSSITSNTTLILGNSVGLLDSDFRGEIKLRFKTITSTGTKKYKIGDRIGQILILPFPSISLEIVDELSNTQRGNGSHGSTGK